MSFTFKIKDILSLLHIRHLTYVSLGIFKKPSQSVLTDELGLIEIYNCMQIS